MIRSEYNTCYIFSSGLSLQMRLILVAKLKNKVISRSNPSKVAVRYCGWTSTPEQTFEGGKKPSSVGKEVKMINVGTI